MGNNHTTSEQFLKEWVKLDKNTVQQTQNNVWVKKSNRNIQMQQYPLQVTSKEQLEEQQKIHQLRHNHPQLVSSLHLKDQSQSQFCSSNYQGKIYIERIPLTLQNIIDIPFPDALHVYSQSLQGFHAITSNIESASRFFPVSQLLIGVNCQGNCKVWLNSRYDRNFPMQVEQITEEKMVANILNVIDENVDFNSLQGKSTPTDYIYSHSRTPSNVKFNQAINLFRNYTNEFFAGQIPERLSCVDRVGGSVNLYNTWRTSIDAVKGGNGSSVNNFGNTIVNNNLNTSQSQRLGQTVPLTMNNVSYIPSGPEYQHHRSPVLVSHNSHSNLHQSPIQSPVQLNRSQVNTVQHSIPVSNNTFNTTFTQPIYNRPVNFTHSTFSPSIPLNSSNIFRNRSAEQTVQIQGLNSRHQNSLYKSPIPQIVRRSFIQNQPVHHQPSHQITHQPIHQVTHQPPNVVTRSFINNNQRLNTSNVVFVKPASQPTQITSNQNPIPQSIFANNNRTISSNIRTQEPQKVDSTLVILGNNNSFNQPLTHQNINNVQQTAHFNQQSVQFSHPNTQPRFSSPSQHQSQSQPSQPSHLQFASNSVNFVNDSQIPRSTQRLANNLSALKQQSNTNDNSHSNFYSNMIQAESSKGLDNYSNNYYTAYTSKLYDNADSQSYTIGSSKNNLNHTSYDNNQSKYNVKLDDGMSSADFLSNLKNVSGNNAFKKTENKYDFGTTQKYDYSYDTNSGYNPRTYESEPLSGLTRQSNNLQQQYRVDIQNYTATIADEHNQDLVVVGQRIEIQPQYSSNRMNYEYEQAQDLTGNIRYDSASYQKSYQTSDYPQQGFKSTFDKYARGLNSLQSNSTNVYSRIEQKYGNDLKYQSNSQEEYVVDFDPEILADIQKLKGIN